MSALQECLNRFLTPSGDHRRCPHRSGLFRTVHISRFGGCGDYRCRDCRCSDLLGADQKSYRVAVIEKGLVAQSSPAVTGAGAVSLTATSGKFRLFCTPLQRWHALSDDIGMDVGFRASGLVYATRTEKDIRNWDNWGKMAKQYGIRSRMLSAAEAKTMTPGSTTNWHGGVHSPDDGYADPALAAPGLMDRGEKGRVSVSALCGFAGWISRQDRSVG